LDRVAVYLSGHRITKNEYFIVASWIYPELAQAVYRQRWQMFKAMKTKGFNLEDTQIKDPDRLHKLLCLLLLAYAWAYTVGIYIAKQKIIRITKYSFFSLGFRELQRAIIALPQHLPQFIQLLNNDNVSFVRQWCKLPSIAKRSCLVYFCQHKYMTSVIFYPQTANNLFASRVFTI
jgi:hypothetical protein